MLKTKLCDMFGVRYPIIQAGMGYMAQPRLVAAVSNAGGLGTLRPHREGRGSSIAEVEEWREEIRQVKALTDKPFGVDIMFAAVADSMKQEYTGAVKRMVEVVCEEKPAYLISALGNPAAAIPDLHAAGVKVMALVGNVKNARRVEAAGVDMVIAQGHEAGGHTGQVTTMVLVPAVVDAVKLPVVAGGGIVDSRQMVAALILGACGVLLGTRFVATHEASAHPNYKQKLLEADEEGTVVTRAFTGKTCRVLRNRLTEEWRDRDKEVLPFPVQAQRLDELYYPGLCLAGWRTDGPGDTDYGFCPAGQGAGLITSLKSVAEVMEELMEGAQAIVDGIRKAAA